MTTLIPRTVLFGNQERTSPRLAPDGNRLAWVAPRNAVPNLWVGSLSDINAARPVTADIGRGIRSFSWTWDGARLLYPLDTGGDENWRLHDVNLGTGETRDLTPIPGVQTRIIATRASRPDAVLVGLNQQDKRLHDAYLLDPATGDLCLAERNPGFSRWLADEELNLRAAQAPRGDGGFNLLVRDNTGGWRTLLAVDPDDATSTELLSFSSDGRRLVLITSVGAMTSRLLTIDVATGDTRVLAADTDADVVAAFLHPVSRDPLIATVLGDRARYQALDPRVQPHLDAIRALHPGDPRFLEADRADRSWLVAFTADTGPTPYFAYFPAERRGRFLFTDQPSLDGYKLAPMEPFRCTARDGVALHGYLTFPTGSARVGLPTVLAVHGGPQSRDKWGYNATVQWLANRGYLCVQVNFRGSTGYGKAFVNAGDREWGGKMHDDLIDTVEHVVAMGWADQKRVGVFGGSYGGYAALVGAAFTPDVFACAVDIVGPSNLRTLLESIPPYWVPLAAKLYRRIGHPELDADFLWSRSPLSRARDIRIPVLIAQGANDPRVKRSESEQIIAVLKDAGIDHEYLLFEDEGHGFAKAGNRIRFYAAAERFFARHLGGRYEA